MTAMQPSDNFAVILNANAGRVTPQLIYQLESYIPKGRLFLTQSQLHARDVLSGTFPSHERIFRVNDFLPEHPAKERHLKQRAHSFEDAVL